VLSTIGPPTHLAATGTTLVWSTDDAATGKSTVFSLPKQPALNEGAKPLLIEGSVTALTANATRAAFATESSFGLPAVHLVVDIANPALPLTLPYPTTSLAFGPDGALYIASNDHVFSNRGGGPSPTQLLTTGGGAIATSDSSIFVLWTPTTPSTLTGFLLLNPGGQTQTVSDTASALASNSTAAFAAIAPAAGKLPDIMDLNPLSAPVVASASGPVAELAVSATEVFWIETVDPNQTRIMRAPYPASSMKAVPKLVVGGYRSIRGLAVDRSADGCVYFWGEPISTGQPAAVRVAPKTP
jgi:hypothetical protein